MLLTQCVFKVILLNIMKTFIGPEFFEDMTRGLAHEAELLNNDLEPLPGSHGGVLAAEGAMGCFQPDIKDGRARTLAISAAYVHFIFKNRTLRIQVIQYKIGDNEFWFRAVEF